MDLDSPITLGQWILLFLVLIFAAFAAGLIDEGVPPLVSQWFSSPVKVSNLSTEELAERVLWPSDLPGDYLVVESRMRTTADVSPIARDLGWKGGYIVRYQPDGQAAYSGSSIQQVISVYPAENISRALPSTRYHRRMAEENHENMIVDELPDPGIGDRSTATKLSRPDDNTSACLIDFVRNDVYEQIMVYGPAPDYETAKSIAAIAAAKIR